MTTRRLFEITLFVALFVMATREIADPDFWWHLRTGQFIVETRTIPRTDIFSFTNNGKEWVTHEWLSEVLIYLLYRTGGFDLLIVSFAAIITASFLIVYSRCTTKPFLAGFALLLGALASAPMWGVRPQMFSVLLTSLFLYLLDRYESGRDHRYILALIPLTVLWVNLHSGFALGLAVIGIYIVGSLAEYFMMKPRRNTLHATRHLTLVFILCLLAVMLNPNGARMYTYPFETLTSRAMQSFIQEWFSPDLHQPEFQPFALLLIATLAAALWSRTRLSLTRLLLLAAFAYAGLRSARHIPLFALIAVPVLTYQLQDLVHRPTDQLQPTSKMLGRINAALVGVILLAGAVRVASVTANQPNVERAKFPAGAVDWLASQKSDFRIFNLYHWGGYLIWRMYPDCPVFIDGRADVYGDQFFEEFARIYGAEPGWEDELAKRDVSLALVEPDSAIAHAMLRTGHWQEIYRDELSVILERE